MNYLTLRLAATADVRAVEIIAERKGIILQDVETLDPRMCGDIIATATRNGHDTIATGAGIGTLLSWAEAEPEVADYNIEVNF